MTAYFVARCWAFGLMVDPVAGWYIVLGPVAIGFGVTPLSELPSKP